MIGTWCLVYSRLKKKKAWMFGPREDSRLWEISLFLIPPAWGQSSRPTLSSLACLGLILPSLALKGQNSSGVVLDGADEGTGKQRSELDGLTEENAMGGIKP